MRGRCWVELVSGKVSKIFRNRSDAVLSSAFERDSSSVREYPRKDAVAAIRQRVFERAANLCEDCGKILTWKTAHMHEKIHRGDGGEISVENSILVCYTCHMSIEHGNRRLRFGE